jgi:hypothetical protein
MKFTLNKRQNSRKPHLRLPWELRDRLIDAPNREQTGRIVVSALYHRDTLTQGSIDAILVNSWIL